MAKDENNAQGGQEGGDGGKNDPNSDLYEDAGPKKILRFFTVVAYMCSVSFMGVALSAYYLFLWEPPNPRLIQRTHHLSADPQAESLIGEPGLNSNNSANQLASETYSGYVPNNLLGDEIGGWNVGEQFSEDRTMNNNHTIMNASLVLSRNSLIDILMPNRTDINDIQTSYEKPIAAFAKVSKDASATVDVPLRTISGSESDKDRLASGRSEWDSSRINHLSHNSIVATDFTDGTVEGKASTTIQPIKRKRKFRRREAPDSKNPHEEVDSISLSDKKILLHTKRDQVQEADQSEVSPGWQTSSPKLISIAITYGVGGLYSLNLNVLLSQLPLSSTISLCRTEARGEIAKGLQRWGAQDHLRHFTYVNGLCNILIAYLSVIGKQLYT